MGELNSTPPLQLDRLAVSEEVDAGGWCQASDVVGEGCGRQIDQIGPLGEADGPPGSPVHGDGVMWLGPADSLCRLLGVEMALIVAWNNAGSPASDWQQRNVDWAHLLQLKMRTCVPRIPPSAGALQKIAERGSAMRAASVSAAIVVGGQDAYLQVAERQEVTGLHLPERQTAGGDWLEQAA